MPHRHHQHGFCIKLDLVAWLNLFKLIKAKLSAKRYWQGPRSQEVGEEGDYT